jgi:ribosomal protein S18 acetylase RimI-like enzyme
VYDTDEIERVVGTFYVPERVEAELGPSREWGGWWVAERAGRVVGAGGGGMTGDGVGEVFVLYVEPAQQGHGAGTAVLDAITRGQLAEGAREQWVAVEPRNTQAIAFYRRRGFVERERVPAYERAGVSLRMSRPLTS